MRFLPRRPWPALVANLALGLASGLTQLACSASEEAGSTGITPPPPTTDATVTFDATGTLTLAPGAIQALGVTGAPAASYQVGFALLGDTLDAWLDAATVQADAAGHASVNLHAPSKAATFQVRASLLDDRGMPGPSAERGVAVSKQGFGSVRVTPVYGGARPVTTWTASVVARSTCMDLTTLPAEAPGALVAAAPAGTLPVVDNAPVGPNLAVAVRAGHFAWGCADSAGPTAGGTVDVSVTVIDKPLDLSTASLTVELTYPPPTSFAPFLADITSTLGGAFLPIGSKDGSVVLNAMAALVPSTSAAAFTQSRIDKGWDAVAAQHFAALTPGLRQRVDAWVAAGLLLQTPAIEAGVLAVGKPDHPQVQVTRFGDVDPATAGVMPGPFTWKPQPDDSLLLVGDLGWAPSRFAAAAALAAAQADFPAAQTVPGALAAAAACKTLASKLGAFGTCDAGCVEQLCDAALASRWNAALAAGATGTVGIKASASATVGDAAQPTALTGHWVGAFSDGSVDATVMGDLAATSP
jgi:hypothetical protein